jgi:hypothetical protein
LVGAFGFYRLLLRSPVLISALLLPHVLILVFSAVKQLPVYPRFFLAGLVLIVMIIVELITWGLSRFDNFKARLWPRLAAVILVTLLSTPLLLRYYSTAKQPYRTALTYVEAIRGSEDIVIVVDLASAGYEYYGPLLGLSEQSYFTARTPERFDELLQMAGQRRVILITSLESVMPAEDEARISNGWERIKTFPALVRDAEVSVWLPTTGP